MNEFSSQPKPRYTPTPEELAIMAEYQEKERLEREAFQSQLERDRERKQHWQQIQAKKKRKAQEQEEYIQYRTELQALIDAGNTPTQAVDIKGPFQFSGDAKGGFLKYGR